MFRGEQYQTNGNNVRTLVRGVTFLLGACIPFFLIGVTPAQAVSTGCTAVRNGAASTSGIDVNFVGDFEAGETVVWTFSGGLADEVTVTPPGGLQPVVNRVVTFTFPTTGTFTIALTGGNAATGTCNETTPEKQAAVKNAVKTLTEMQLIQSLAFQGQLLTELTNLFLSGAVPVMTLERLELQLAALVQKQTTLNNEAAHFRGVINGAPGRIGELNNRIRLLSIINYGRDRHLYELSKDVSRWLWSHYYRDPWNFRGVKYSEFQEFIDALIVQKREALRIKRYELSQINSRESLLPIFIYDKTVEVGRLEGEYETHYYNILEDTYDDRDESRQKRMLLGLRNEYCGDAGSCPGVPAKPRYGRIGKAKAALESHKNELATTPARRENAIKAIRELEQEIEIYEKVEGNRNAERAGFEAQIEAVRQQEADAQKRLAVITGKLAPINDSIAQIRSEMAALRARVGQPVTPFAGANLQAAFGLTQERTSSPQATNPFGLKGARNGMSFFTDLNSFRRQEQIRLQQAGGATGPQVLTEQGSAEILNPAWNIWAKGDFSDFESNQPGADREGQAHTFATGAYYAPSARFMVGTMYRYRDSQSESVAQASDVGTRGHGVGVHSTLVLTPKLSASAQVLYEHSDNDLARGTSAITPVATSGSFEAGQFVASGTLQGSLWRGPFWLRPAAGITYAHVDTEAYTDSAGTRIPGQTTEQGQLTFGPTIGFRKWRETGAIKFIEPSFTATGVWTFRDDGDTTLASGAIIEQDDVAAQFSAGLSILLRNDTQLSFSGGYSGLGDSEVETWSLGGQISIPLGGR